MEAAKDLWQTTLVDSDRSPRGKALLQRSDRGENGADSWRQDSQT
jgi:hypothetical protein